MAESSLTSNSNLRGVWRGHRDVITCNNLSIDIDSINAYEKFYVNGSLTSIDVYINGYKKTLDNINYDLNEFLVCVEE